MKFSHTPIGFEYKTDSHLVFFGNKFCTLESLTKYYPDLNFRQLKQTHSDVLIQSVNNSIETEADAHWTTDPGIALVIKTADCLPLMIYSEEKKIVLAIHAGWRGVENQIALKALRLLNELFSLKNPIDFYLGPHIHQESFEVDADVKEKLIQSSFGLKTSSFVMSSSDKFLIDLSQIILSQVKQICDFSFHLCSFDTKTTSDFHSYRRDKAASGRNLSFISLL